MLVPEGGGHKVLLTSTVFPVSGVAGGPAKPRFRLLGKRSSDFATRVVAASAGTPLSAALYIYIRMGRCTQTRTHTKIY